MQPARYLAVLEDPRFRWSSKDKLGGLFLVRPSDVRDYEAVLGMFDEFEPKGGFLHLPPANPEQRRQWVHAAVAQRVNVVAEAGGRIVGHTSLIDVEPGVRGELAIMVHQAYRNRGIGSRMVDLLIELARALGYQRVWMLVEELNTRAVRVFHRKGFHVIGPRDLEIELELVL